MVKWLRRFRRFSAGFRRAWESHPTPLGTLSAPKPTHQITLKSSPPCWTQRRGLPAQIWVALAWLVPHKGFRLPRRRQIWAWCPGCRCWLGRRGCGCARAGRCRVWSCRTSRTAVCREGARGRRAPINEQGKVVLGLCSTPGQVPLRASDGNTPCSHQSPCPSTHRGSAPDSRLLSSSPECRSQRSPLSSLSSLWLRSEDERLRLECVARYSELLYTWGTGERLGCSGYAAGGGSCLWGEHPGITPLGFQRTDQAPC